MKPTPHARRRPNITLTMLEDLRLGAISQKGIIGGRSGNALRRRHLAGWSTELQKCVITASGRLLIRTQYEALKQVLPAKKENQ